MARAAALWCALAALLVLRTAQAACPQSGAVFTAASGAFETAHSYANNENCWWTITSGLSGVTITFSQFTLESNYDYVRVYRGTQVGGTLLLTLTGSLSAGASYMFMEQSVTVSFTTDSSVVMWGFAATYTAVDVEMRVPLCNALTRVCFLALRFGTGDTYSSAAGLAPQLTMYSSSGSVVLANALSAARVLSAEENRLAADVVRLNELVYNASCTAGDCALLLGAHDASVDGQFVWTATSQVLFSGGVCVGGMYCNFGYRQPSSATPDHDYVRVASSGFWRVDPFAAPGLPRVLLLRGTFGSEFSCRWSSLPACPGVVFVSASGSNNGDGLTPATAMASVAMALDCTCASTIAVSGIVPLESVALVRRSVTITGNLNGFGPNAVIRCSASRALGVVVDVDTSVDVLLSDFSLQDCPVTAPVVLRGATRTRNVTATFAPPRYFLADDFS